MELIRTLVRTARALTFHASSLISRRGLYDIAPGYRHRRCVNHYDDTANTDEWQREVYLSAQSVMREKGLLSVHDVGCGSGYKLVHILGEFATTGIDLPGTISWV